MDYYDRFRDKAPDAALSLILHSMYLFAAVQTRIDRARELQAKGSIEASKKYDKTALDLCHRIEQILCSPEPRMRHMDNARGEMADAMRAVTDNTGEDLSWLTAAIGQRPDAYLQTNWPSLTDRQRYILTLRMPPGD